MKLFSFWLIVDCHKEDRMSQTIYFSLFIFTTGPQERHHSYQKSKGTWWFLWRQLGGFAYCFFSIDCSKVLLISFFFVFMLIIIVKNCWFDFEDESANLMFILIDYNFFFTNRLMIFGIEWDVVKINLCGSILQTDWLIGFRLCLILSLLILFLRWFLAKGRNSLWSNHSGVFLSLFVI